MFIRRRCSELQGLQESDVRRLEEGVDTRTVPHHPRRGHRTCMYRVVELFYVHYGLYCTINISRKNYRTYEDVELLCVHYELYCTISIHCIFKELQYVLTLPYLLGFIIILLTYNIICNRHLFTSNPHVAIQLDYFVVYE